MSRRALVMAVVAGAGLLLGLVLLARTVGPLAAPPVVLADATALAVDTVSIRGRRVEASVNGVVREVHPGGRLWLSVADGTIELRVDDAAGVEVEDRILATGRVRSRGGRRVVEAGAWVEVRGSARPPATGGL